MIAFKILPGAGIVDLGYLPSFLDVADPRPVREQLNQNYAHGGGWRPLEGWVMDPATQRIKYPGDPSLKPLAVAQLRDEKLIFYAYAWLLILQPDGSYEVSRID